MNDKDIVKELNNEDLLQQLSDLEYYENKGGIVPPPVVKGLILLREEKESRGI